jgi:hypothetical protein
MSLHPYTDVVDPKQQSKLQLLLADLRRIGPLWLDPASWRRNPQAAREHNARVLGLRAQAEAALITLSRGRCDDL